MAASVLGRSYMLRSHAYATQGAEHTSTIRGHVGRTGYLCIFLLCAHQELMVVFFFLTIVWVDDLVVIDCDFDDRYC